MELSKLKSGDSVVTGRITRGQETGLRIQKVAKVTLTQIVLQSGDRYQIRTGSRIGGLGGAVLRPATQADFDREQAQRRKSEESQNQISANEVHREELEGLFPDALRPVILARMSNQPGRFNLEFHNVEERDVRKMAELLKSFGQS